MANIKVYYLAWEEDEWLDELLDSFEEVIAMVPSLKTLETIRADRQREEAKRAVYVVNVSGERKRTEPFLQALTADRQLSRDPLCLVGAKEEEADTLREMYPDADVVAISGFVVEFDFASVLARLEEKWREKR